MINPAAATTKTMQEKYETYLPATNKSNENETEPKYPTPTSDSSDTAVKSMHRLFVGGLPHDITDPEFLDFFSQFGDLSESAVMFDRQKKRPRGFGFVTFTNPDVSKTLLQMGHGDDGIGRLVMRGKICEIKAASPKPATPPTRGVGRKTKKNGRRSPDPRHDHLSQEEYHYCYHKQIQNSPTFGQDEQIPIVHHPHENFAMVYAPAVPGYAPPMYHQSAVLPHHPGHPPLQGMIPLLAPPMAAPFYPPTLPHIPANCFFPHQQQQHSNFAFAPNENIVPVPVHFCA